MHYNVKIYLTMLHIYWLDDNICHLLMVKTFLPGKTLWLLLLIFNILIISVINLHPHTENLTGPYLASSHIYNKNVSFRHICHVYIPHIYLRVSTDSKPHTYNWTLSDNSFVVITTNPPTNPKFYVYCTGGCWLWVICFYQYNQIYIPWKDTYTRNLGGLSISCHVYVSPKRSP